MYTPRLTHHKIREMCDRGEGEPVTVAIRDLAVEMGMNVDMITEHVVVLKALGLVVFADEHKEFITLTPKGRTTGL